MCRVCVCVYVCAVYKNVQDENEEKRGKIWNFVMVTICEYEFFFMKL